jgi:hypothetical protein
MTTATLNTLPLDADHGIRRLTAARRARAVYRDAPSPRAGRRSHPVCLIRLV